MRDPIFLIGIVPGPDIQQEIRTFQTYASEVFESSHALKSPPHITLFPPFRWNESQFETLKKAVSDFAGLQSSFYLQIANFNCFSPHVIYVDVEKKRELMDLQKGLERNLGAILGLTNNSPHDFNPHITVAFRDLKRNYFLRALAHYSAIRYERIFLVNQLMLLKHNGQNWDEFGSFKFKS